MQTASHGSMQMAVEQPDEAERTSGLDELEVRTRRERGEGNDFQLPTSRSLASILRQNLFTLINLILFSIGAVMVSIGRPDEALASVSLILMNIIVGLIQEVRAKRKLDRIALLTRPKVSVIREGEERAIDPAELVRGDLVVVRAGDQIVVDGLVVGCGQIEVDESLLTGESDRITKRAGDHVLSGSFVVAGKAMFVVRRVGAKSFANTLAAEARTFRVVKTPLQRDVDFVLRLLLMVALFIGLLLIVSALLSDIPLMRGVQMAAVIAGLVPNGLFFMVIVAYAMGAVRIVSHGALVQQANSVESLSNVVVLCMDKTGTLTANRIVYDSAIPLGMAQEALERALADFASSATATNKTTEALIAALGGNRLPLHDEVAFSSERKWSAIAFDSARGGAYVLGAPEVLAPHLDAPLETPPEADAWIERGLRVLLFAHNAGAQTLHDGEGRPVLPTLAAAGLIAFRDELRPDAGETLAEFARAGIELKIISGDNPQAVAALARQAGMPGDLTVVSGQELAALDDAGWAQVVDETSVFGRVAPQQKERLVRTLREQGYYVAMIGDGVNDVLSLKAANLGIAMESGSGATRSVADMILLRDSFAALPPAFLEGQRIVSGMRDILRLYLARAVTLVLMILSTSVVGVGFPYIPKHVTLVALLTIGLPTFAIAVWARPDHAHKRLLASVLHFSFPAGIATFLFAFGLYVFTFNSIVNEGRTVAVLREDIAEFQVYAGIDYEIYTPDQFRYEVAVLFSQSVLTVFSVLAGLVLIMFVEPPLRWFAGGDRYSGDVRPTLLALALGLVFAAIMADPALRRLFELLPLEARDYGVVGAALIAWLLALRATWRTRLFSRFLNLEAMLGFTDDWLSEDTQRA
jgi:cation-transporting ATPase E